MLARALASNTGVMSYHLRELSKAGLIELESQEGRARYWRLRSGDVRIPDPQLSIDPQTAENAIDRRLAHFSASLTHYRRRGDLSPAWREAALFSESAAVLTTTELTAFGEEYLALLCRWSGRTSADPTARPVRIALFAYPDSNPL
jgi:hypothetical protein